MDKPAFPCRDVGTITVELGIGAPPADLRPIGFAGASADATGHIGELSAEEFGERLIHDGEDPAHARDGRPRSTRYPFTLDDLTFCEEQAAEIRQYLAALPTPPDHDGNLHVWTELLEAIDKFTRGKLVQFAGHIAGVVIAGQPSRNPRCMELLRHLVSAVPAPALYEVDEVYALAPADADVVDHLPTIGTAVPRFSEPRAGDRAVLADLAQTARDYADRAAFLRTDSRNSAWPRGLVLTSSAAALDGVGTALLLGEETTARLRQIAGILERAETESALTPLELLGSALSRVIASEVQHQLAQERR